MESKKTFWHDLFYTMLVLGAAVAVCSLLSQMHDDNNPFAVLIFVLAVAVVALVTNGYLWGVAASVIGVFCVNFMFTYPFWSFDMSITGYPLTFIVLLVVSVVISTLTTRVKQSERLRYEIESEKLRADLLRALSHDLRTRSPLSKAPTACCWSSLTSPRWSAVLCWSRSVGRPAG